MRNTLGMVHELSAEVPLERARDTVAQWFAAQRGGSMMLPSGWFGRPYDNEHALTWSAVRSTRLLLELDRQLLLVFTGESTVSLSGRDLVISGFTQLVFVCQGYGDMTPHVDAFDAGEVRFFAAPGAGRQTEGGAHA